MRAPAPAARPCEGCPLRLRHLGARGQDFDHVVALAGNPNVGKSTLFNALTGLKQHVGNWPGKTVARAEGGFEIGGARLKVVDLPGTYSLLAYSPEEEIARDFLLFGRADATIVLIDATALERNLNLVLQILQITSRVVVALNLMDEARRRGIVIDHRALARELGVPVVPIVARTGEGIATLLATLLETVADRGQAPARPVPLEPQLEAATAAVSEALHAAFPTLASRRWVALRLLDGDPRVREGLAGGELLGEAGPARPGALDPVLAEAERLRVGLGPEARDRLVESLFREAEGIAGRVVQSPGIGARSFQARLDRVLTSRLWGPLVMVGGLALVFWITIVGANVPSAMLFKGTFALGHWGRAAFEALQAPWWLTGFLWDGVYRGLAWVVSVMLPPMAIFFPLFTLLEDLGYLPRVAFNLDGLFRRVGAHGKQALTMAMGLGCNAAGVVAARVIESPRERLIAILTNNFMPCNGRWPTLIVIASALVAAAFSPGVASMVAAGAVIGVTLVGLVVTLVVSWLLSKTVLRGVSSTFFLELPPFRRPDVLRILYTSFIDRTLFVLWRAVVMAAPAGGLIWLLANVQAGGVSLAQRVQQALEPFGWVVGLDGAILLAYIVAIPANEIVLPTLIMVYTGAGMMVEVEGLGDLRTVLVAGAGWTLLTAVNLMLFSVLHNPCSTTIWTIWSETRSLKWTALATVLPLLVAFVAVAGVTWVARALQLA
ncbi:MAG: ferrous iron transport protein B [Deinococcales bacterium]